MNKYLEFILIVAAGIGLAYLPMGSIPSFILRIILLGSRN